MLTDLAPTFQLLGAPYLEYLPVIDLLTGRLLGLEALVRWMHPTQGRIAPNDLIPMAEASGDIGPLNRWVLIEACAQATQWQPSMQLGVNCTVAQLCRGEISVAVAEALRTTGLDADRLTVEVTEDAVIDDRAGADLHALSSMGVHLTLDDVGTNWSSFAPLQRNAISTVKIDGSFIAGLELTQGINRLVVETVINTSQSLGMTALVEMVETAEQLATVRAFGADAAQGFFFSRPLSSDDAHTFASAPTIPHFSLKERRQATCGGEDLSDLLVDPPAVPIPSFEAVAPPVS